MTTLPPRSKVSCRTRAKAPMVSGAGPWERPRVGGFHHDQVGGGEVLRVAQKGLVQVSDVAGKDDHARLRPLGHGHLDGGRAQQVAHIHHADAHAGAHLHALAVAAGVNEPVRAQRVLLGVERLHGRLALALGLAGFPLGVAFLNVGRIQQHDAAQVGGGVGGEDGAPEAVFVKQRQVAAVVDVRVRQKHIVDPAFGHGQRRVFVQVRALLHAVVHHDVPARGFKQKPAARHLAGRAQKGELHALIPPLRFSADAAPAGHRSQSAGVRGSIPLPGAPSPYAAASLASVASARRAQETRLSPKTGALQQPVRRPPPGQSAASSAGSCRAMSPAARS